MPGACNARRVKCPAPAMPGACNARRPSTEPGKQRGTIFFAIYPLSPPDAPSLAPSSAWSKDRV
jgi:hypothetical protein